METNIKESKIKKKHGMIFWFVLMVLSSVILGASMMVMEVFVSYGMFDSKALFRKNCNEWLMRDYASYALSGYRDDFNLSHLENTNFRYAVFGGHEPSSEEAKDASAYLVCTIPEEDLAGGTKDLFCYSATLGEHSVFYYNVDSLWDSYAYVTNSSQYYDPSAEGTKHYVSKFVYSWNTDSSYAVCDDGTCYPVYIGIDSNTYDDSDALRDLLNEKKDGWKEEAAGEVELMVEASEGGSSYLFLDDIDVIKAENLRDYDTAKEGEIWSIDFNTLSVWTPAEDAGGSDHEDYYLYAEVADPLNMESDDLFTRSRPLIDMACNLRFLPVLTALVSGVLFAVSFVMFVIRFFAVIKKGWKKLSYQWRGNVPFLFRMIGICVIATMAEFFVMIAALYNDAAELIVIGWFFQTIILAPLFIITSLQLNRVSKGAQALAAGNMNSPVDTSHMMFDLKTLGESINSAGEGLELAVNERMKSERFRTELISNVSHDIKTPLTSIISYVELLKGQPEGESANPEYLEILEKQSVKLKKLLEDLIEASKAQTGTLKAELSPCNVNTVLHQVMGEYKEKLDEAGLDLNIRIPEEDISIMADTKHLQRVLDNLFVNVSKYSQPGTRVYVNLSGGSDEAAIEIKNTSREPLNVTSDELLERFVRGDSSRNSEGNGLGLSIAQSLMELMNGKLKLIVDGDLFKVILLFPRIKE